jgi:hypothetical protein
MRSIGEPSGKAESFIISNDDVSGLTDHEIEQMVRASGLI